MIYLKRYSYNSAIYRSEKLRQRVSIPRYLTFCKHCDEKVEYTSADPTYFPQKPVYSPPIDAEAAPPTDKELELVLTKHLSYAEYRYFIEYIEFYYCLVLLSCHLTRRIKVLR